MKRIKRNANCLLLCMVMLLGMLPADALATADEEAVFYEEVVIHNLGEEALEICEDDSFSPYVVSDTGSSIYYGRNALAQMSNSAAYLFAYDQIVAGIDSAAEEISVYDKVHPITTSEINMVMDAYRRDYTQHFWLGNSYRYSYSSKTVINLYPAYNMTGSALDEAKVKFEAAPFLSGAAKQKSRKALFCFWSEMGKGDSFFSRCK